LRLKKKQAHLEEEEEEEEEEGRREMWTVIRQLFGRKCNFNYTSPDNLIINTTGYLRV
jgi:hypothetical protein